MAKNTCQYINFLYFSNLLNNWKNMRLHWNILLLKTCSNLSSNFFTPKGVVAKPFELELWNFAWKNRRSCTFRWYNAEFLNIIVLRTIKVSFVAVVIDGRVRHILSEIYMKVSGVTELKRKAWRGSKYSLTKRSSVISGQVNG